MDFKAAERLYELDRTRVWHPFTQMRDWEAENPLVIERGEGNWLYDVEGRKFLDGISSLWCNVHGHRRPEIDEAVRDQLDKVAHSTMLGLANVPAIELAARLTDIAPEGLTRVFYSDSGSTAVEVALKMAYQCAQQRGETQRDRFIAFENAYHGDTVGSVSLGGIDQFHRIYHPLLFDAWRLPYPHPYRCKFDSDSEQACLEAHLKAAEEMFAEHGERACACVIEPKVQGAAGIVVSPDWFLTGIRELCDKYGVLLVADEVATGFGRTGTMFACERESVRPDFLCVAKGLTGGYLPLAATLATEEVYRAFYGDYADELTFFHGHTYTGNPLACAAAIASLEIFEREHLIDALAPKIERLSRLLEPLKDHPHVGDVRQAGMMIGIELVSDKDSKEPYDWSQRMGVQVCSRARKHAVILRPLGNNVVLMPPLSITEQEIDLLIETTAASIDEVTG